MFTIDYNKYIDTLFMRKQCLNAYVCATHRHTYIDEHSSNKAPRKIQNEKKKKI